VPRPAGTIRTQPSASGTRLTGTSAGGSAPSGSWLPPARITFSKVLRSRRSERRSVDEISSVGAGRPDTRDQVASASVSQRCASSALSNRSEP
jgi:hypothetical protein